MRSLYPKSVRLAAFFPIALLSVVGLIDTARAQDNLLVTPSSVPFNFAYGATGFQTATVQVTSSAAALNYSLSYQSANNWFTAVATTSVTPGQINISASPGQLLPGTYTGSITLTPSGAGNTPVVIPLSLVVGSSTSISVSPASLTFSATAGSSVPTAPQVLTVSSATNNIPFTTSVSYSQSGVANWLSITPPSGVTTSTLAVTANPAGLSAGTYTAAITMLTTTGVSQVVNVTFTVGGQPTISTNLTSIPFFYQIGQSQTQFSSAYLTIGSTSSSSIPVNISTTMANCPGFLGVSQLGSINVPVGSPATVQVYAAGLASFTAPVTCTGSVVITSTGTSNPTVTIPVTLTVNNNPLMVLTPLSASFTYQLAGALPANQNLSISSTTSGLQFTASSSQPWLAVTPSGVTSSSSQISLSLVPAPLSTLIPGTYTANVTVNAAGASNSPITVPVTLTVSANAMLTFNPPFANYVYENGQAQPNTQSLLIGSTGGQIPFVISIPTTTGTQFLSVYPTSGIAPTVVTLTVSPSGLAPSTYQQYLTVTPTGATQNQNPQTVPVQLIVSAAGVAQLNASPQVLSFSFAQGSNTRITPQSIALTSTDSTYPMTISNVTTNASWLTTNFINGSNLTTPQNLQVTVVPTFLVPSATPYTANLTITATNQQGQSFPTTVQVTFSYTSGITLTATPTQLAFTQTVNGVAPASQSVALGASSTAGTTLPVSASVSTVTGGAWLTVSPTSGTAPTSLSVSLTSVAATLTPGTYSGSVIIYGQNSANANGTLTVPVTLTVAAAPALTVSPAALTFSGTVSAANPAAQTLQVSAPNTVGPVSFTTSASTASGNNWLAVTPISATAPSSISVSVNTAGLAPGSYTGTVTLTPSGGAAPTVVQVSLTVTAQVAPAVMQVINAASGVTGSVSPGEIVSLFGTALGPVSAAGLTLTAQGNVATTLAGVSVTFNGVPAPLTYVSATQINCVVPYEVSGSSAAQIFVSYNGVTSGATSLNIIPTQPGIFTQNSSGSGAGAILLPNYSTVTPSNAAPRGSTIVIYATGGGLTSPASVTGAVAGASLMKTTAPVTVLIGGISATVTYAGSAPGLVEGVLQINAVVPTSISAGNQPILVTVGGNSSQNGVTVAVQ